MRRIVIEDQEDVLMVCRRRGYECYADAAAALVALGVDDEPVEVVYLDVGGIFKDGVDAHVIARECKIRGIKVIMTTNNDEERQIFRGLYGFPWVSKVEVMARSGAWHDQGSDKASGQ